jgi:hypothetical protein
LIYGFWRSGMGSKIEKAKLVELFSRSRTPMLLGQKLDNAYEIYNQCNVVLTYIIPAKDRDEILSAQKEMLEFLKKNLNVETLPAVVQRMSARELRKKTNLEYVPGIKPPKLTTLPDPNLGRTKAQSHLRYLAMLVLAASRHKVLRVNTYGRKKDAKYNIKLFKSAEERIPFRIGIKNGKFIEIDAKIAETLCDTTHQISHKKKSYASFVININGELSIFDHDDMKNLIAHSSINDQKTVFSAGEIKIVSGRLIALSDQSGHYRPDIQNFYETLKYFKHQGVDISQSIVSFHAPHETLTQLENPPEFGQLPRYTYSGLELYEKFHVVEELELPRRLHKVLDKKLLEITSKNIQFTKRHISFLENQLSSTISYLLLPLLKQFPADKDSRNIKKIEDHFEKMIEDYLNSDLVVSKLESLSIGEANTKPRIR